MGVSAELSWVGWFAWTLARHPQRDIIHEAHVIALGQPFGLVGDGGEEVAEYVGWAYSPFVGELGTMNLAFGILGLGICPAIHCH